MAKFGITISWYARHKCIQTMKQHLTPRALDAGDSARCTGSFLASGFLCSQAESTPAPARVTQTVGRWRTQNKFTKDNPLHS
jgi:hypothetical protein